MVDIRTIFGYFFCNKEEIQNNYAKHDITIILWLKEFIFTNLQKVMNREKKAKELNI